MSFSGCGRPGQDSAIMEALLHGHTGSHLRGGLRGQGQGRRGETRIAPNHQRSRDEGCHHTRLCQQAGSSRWSAELLSPRLICTFIQYFYHYYCYEFIFWMSFIDDPCCGSRVIKALDLFSTAMKPHEIQEKLGLTRIRDRNWYVQPSCATTGDGLYEGLTWLTSNIKTWLWRGFPFVLFHSFPCRHPGLPRMRVDSSECL